MRYINVRQFGVPVPAQFAVAKIWAPRALS
jgi:hypothetical protein